MGQGPTLKKTFIRAYSRKGRHGCGFGQKGQKLATIGQIEGNDLCLIFAHNDGLELVAYRLM